MLKAVELGKEYNGKVALSDVSLTFPEKGMVIIKGESGCGKSTLLNLLTACDTPTRGKIELEGVEITPDKREYFRLKYCSNIYQDYMLLEDLTVSENIELSMQACGQDYTVDDVEELLSKVGIPKEYLNKKASKLSGGEKQRVAIARAISKKDAMIFADEPTGNLDSKNGDKVMELLKDISKDRLVVVVSHNEKQNEKYGDYTVELFDGVVLNSDLPNEEKMQNKQAVFEKRGGKLKPRSVARLAYWGFEKNKIKTIVSIVAFIAICMLCIVSTVALLGDVSLSLSRSLDKCEKKNVFMQFYYDPKEGFDYESVADFKENMKYQGLEVIDFPIGINHYEVDLEERRKLDRAAQISKAIIYDSKVGVDVDVICGDFPQKHNDIMLPSYFAQYMIKVFEDFKRDSIEDLVGMPMKYNVRGVRLDDSRDHYTFTICGIFDEGYFLNDYDELSDENKDFLVDVNLLAECVILAPQARGIMFNNANIFYNAHASGSVSFYSETHVGSMLVQPYGYDKYGDYANDYPELKQGEIYLDKTLAEKHGVAAGDTVEVSMWTYQLVPGSIMNFETIKVDSFDVTVKAVITASDKKSFAIFSREDYMESVIAEDLSQKSWGLYFNAKNIKDTYAFFRDMTSQGKKSGVLKYGGLIDVAFTENSRVLHSLYSVFIGYRYFVVVPLVAISFIGMTALGFVSLSYLIASKGKSYNVLRSLGFGRKHIATILAVQVFTVVAVECIFGVALGALGCYMFGEAFSSFVKPGVTLAVANEVVMPMGFVAPLIIVGFSMMIGGAIVLFKTKTLFSKSIMENKTS